MASNVVVIGGSGFIGSHTADALSQANMNVTVLDLKKSPWIENDQKMITGDIIDKEFLAETFSKGKTEVVYHMAGVADIDECHKDPYRAIQANVLGTASVLEACVASGVKKIIFASSAYVSSNMGSFYRVTKQASENIIEEYSKKYGLKFVVLRYGTLYGPRSDSRNQLYRIIQQALTTQKVTFKGFGDSRREFIHVLDAAKLSVRVLEEEFENQKILITGPRSVQYKELLEMLNEMLGNKIAIEYQPDVLKTHYKLSPYSFRPDVTRKLVGDYHIEFGQGLLSLIQEIHDLKNAA